MPDLNQLLALRNAARLLHRFAWKQGKRGKRYWLPDGKQDAPANRLYGAKAQKAADAEKGGRTRQRANTQGGAVASAPARQKREDDTPTPPRKTRRPSPVPPSPGPLAVARAEPNATLRAGTKGPPTPRQPANPRTPATQTTGSSVKEPHEMSREEFRNQHAGLQVAELQLKEAQESLGGGRRWGDTRRFQGRSAGKRLERVDKVRERWSKQFNKADSEHKKLVKDALAAGKPVPPEVLADYPDLAEKAALRPPNVKALKASVESGIVSNRANKWNYDFSRARAALADASKQIDGYAKAKPADAVKLAKDVTGQDASDPNDAAALLKAWVGETVAILSREPSRLDRQPGRAKMSESRSEIAGRLRAAWHLVAALAA